jgi:hypothetical protein
MRVVQVRALVSVFHPPPPVFLVCTHRAFRVRLPHSPAAQLNLVYVIGIAPSIAKEALLERNEFFGQYGRVVKVVVNRQALPGGGSTDARAPSSSA